MKTILTILLMNLVFLLNAQPPEEYKTLVKQADELYKNKQYLESAQKYSAAFWTNEGKAVPGHRYDAACSWALANVADSAFYHLFRLAESPITKYKNHNKISTDANFSSLHSDSRWDKLLTIVKQNKDEFEKDYDKPLVALLDSIHKEDQQYRDELDVMYRKYENSSPEIKDFWKKINYTDSVNLILISKILDERGWLGSKVVSPSGNMTLFLVIQHSDSATQAKYLPMMRDAVKNGNASASSLALLEDRLALRQGKKQIYGSQIGLDKETEKYTVQDLEDPDNVDKRRSEVGLQPLAEYVKKWDIVWDVEEYKKSKKINGFKKNK